MIFAIVVAVNVFFIGLLIGGGVARAEGLVDTSSEGTQPTGENPVEYGATGAAPEPAPEPAPEAGLRAPCATS